MHPDHSVTLTGITGCIRKFLPILLKVFVPLLLVRTEYSTHLFVLTGVHHSVELHLCSHDIPIIV